MPSKAVLFLVLCCLAASAWALAPVPGIALPGQIERQFQEAPKARSKAAPLSAPVKAQPVPDGADAIRFHVTNILVEGVTVYSPAELAADLAPLQRREVSLAELYLLANQITARYRNDGYLLSQVFVPEQTIANGVVQLRTLTGKFNRLNARFGAMNLDQAPTPKTIDAFQRRKGELHEEIAGLPDRIAQLKQQRKETPKRIRAGDLPEEQRFRLLSGASKHFIDTVKMIAYLSHPDAARDHLVGLFNTEADLLPDPEARTLTVRLHHGANASADRATAMLCEALNETSTVFPRSDLRLWFQVGSGQNLGDQVV